MKDIWAPWRIEYIQGPKPGTCVFCEALTGDDPLVVKRGPGCYAIMNRFPYTAGHCMVVPDRHVGDLADLEPAEVFAVMSLVNELIAAIRATMNPDGFNVGCNIGKAAGAGIAEHFHMHVVPRWSGDTNFMAVLDDVHIISEHVMKTRDKIAKALT